jgi:hypothetical protein
MGDEIIELTVFPFSKRVIAYSFHPSPTMMTLGMNVSPAKPSIVLLSDAVFEPMLAVGRLAVFSSSGLGH